MYIDGYVNKYMYTYKNMYLQINMYIFKTKFHHDTNYLHILMIICLWGNHPRPKDRGHTWEETELCLVAPGVCEMLQGNMLHGFPWFLLGTETSYKNKI